MSRRMPTIAVLIFASILALPACGGGTGAGKTYRIGIFASPSAVNFWGANASISYWDMAVMAPTRTALFGVTDLRFQLIPQAAADWASPLQAEGESWVSTVTLKKGILWSDGRPLTAKDVAFTYNTALRFGLVGGNWSLWADGNYLDRVEAPGEYTVRFVYHTKPGMARHEWGALQAFIACEGFWKPLVEEAAAPLAGLKEPGADAGEAEWEAYTAKQSEAVEKLFSIAPEGEPLAGPFLSSRREEGSFIENIANTNFFSRGVVVTEYESGAYREAKPGGYEFLAYGEASGEKTLDYVSGPNVEKVVYSVYSDQTAALLALKKGEIDFILNPQGLQKGLAESAREEPKLAVLQNASSAVRFLAFNTRREPMGDRAFRQAVATLIDREFLTSTILQDVAFPVYSFVPETNTEWYNGSIPKWGVQPDGSPMDREQRLNKAVEILEQAGYSWNGAGKPVWDSEQGTVIPGGTLVQPGGAEVPELTILSPTYGYDPMRATFAIWIAVWLNEAGIPTRTRMLGFQTLMGQTVGNQDFDIAMLGFQLGLFPSYLRDFWNSQQSVPGGKNPGGYSSPEFDRLSDQLLTCDSYESCKPVADQIQVLAAGDAPWIALFDTGVYEIYAGNLKYPYTDTRGGLQYLYGLPSLVTVN